MILPAISIKQPWVYAILKIGKNVENRTWPLPKKFMNRLILLHAGKSLDEAGYAWLSLEAGYQLLPVQLLPKGGIIGALVFSGKPVRSEWAEEGLCHWHIERAWPVPFYPCKGSLGFFKVDYPHEVSA